MPADAFLLTLLAAALHAGWNLVVKSGSDRLVSALAVTAGAATVSAVVLVLAGLPPDDAIPYLAASCVVHTAYIVMLAMAYERADFALAYPIARGMAPLLVTIGGITFADDDPSALGMAGVVLVATAVLGLVQSRRAGQRVDAALVTGVCIATYSVIDGKAARVTGESVKYLAALFILHLLVLTAAVVVIRRGVPSLVGVGRTYAVGGTASALAYLLVLLASERAPLGLVSGIRELSVVLGLVAGARLLGEPVTGRHAVAVVGAAAGAALIGLS